MTLLLLHVFLSALSEADFLKSSMDTSSLRLSPQVVILLAEATVRCWPAWQVEDDQQPWEGDIRRLEGNRW